jgi:hypothetical protein
MGNILGGKCILPPGIDIEFVNMGIKVSIVLSFLNIVLRIILRDYGF